MNSTRMQPDGDQREFQHILALGSPHGDDQAGWLVADELDRLPQFQGRSHKLGTPWDLLARLKSTADPIIIDACVSSSAPGTIHELTPRQFESFRGSLASSHGGNLSAALQLARTLGYDLSRIVIFAIEIESAEPGNPVSDAVLRSVGELAARIVRDRERDASRDACSVRGARDA